MALDELLAGLEAEAASEMARLEAETHEEANRIVDAARAEARVLQEEAARATERELQDEVEQRRAQARLHVATAVREAREDAFREFLADVQLRLATLRDSEQYRSVLRALIDESTAALAAGTELRVDARDERLAAELIADRPRLNVVAALETAGGVELASADGRMVRNTIEERLANAEQALRLIFGNTLEAPAPPAPP
jgi:vacuolar-type H+-ATPase subunit E/Vma4